MKYQAIIIDLDGTLLNDHNQISDNNIEAIKLALSEGYQITLASGRPHNLMQPFAKQLGIELPLICCNGAYQYHPVQQRVLNSQVIEPQVMASLLDTLNLGQFYFTLYCENGIYATQESSHFNGLKQQIAQLGATGNMQIVASVQELLNQCGDVYKVLVSSQDKVALCQLRDALQADLQADLSTPNKLDITADGVNKGQATLCWLNQFNIKPKQTIAFGDGDNDAEMFRVVGEPVAMANASPALRGLANLIITDNNGCGIGQYLRLVVSEGQHTCQHSYCY
ncbi:HAD family hydrolase [Vibrio sp. LaRot3]|uniref:HAD family hydrolase n=1 Tax=Vibrio sp. LaRot3 TaxID=2998829 RepID=UPI0022CDDB1F|nr:HAD family hydrolase [Vibrio sp. LaRot3]MDA0150499.1 HAD family hydrolase [Vibrio sp. LaRot3]